MSASIRARISGLTSMGTELFRASMSVKPVSRIDTDLPFVSKYPRFLFVAMCEGAVALVPMPCLSISVRSSASVNFFGGDVLDFVFVIFLTATFCPSSTSGRSLSFFVSNGYTRSQPASFCTEPIESNISSSTATSRRVFSNNAGGIRFARKWRAMRSYIFHESDRLIVFSISNFDAYRIGWIGGWSCPSFLPFLDTISPESMESAYSAYSPFVKPTSIGLNSKSSAYLLVSVLG